MENSQYTLRVQGNFFFQYTHEHCIYNKIYYDVVFTLSKTDTFATSTIHIFAREMFVL